MALKFKIDTASFESLSDELKAEYKKAGDGYELDVSGIEDTGALRRAVDHEKAKRKEATDRVRSLESTVEELQSGNDNRVNTLQANFDALKTSSEAEKQKYTSFITTSAIDAAATGIANKISTAPALIMPHLKSRLTVDLAGDTPQVKVLGTDGKAGTLTLDELANEFVGNKDFSAIIKGSGASGGAGNTSKTGGANNFNNNEKRFDYATATPAEIVAYQKASKKEDA